MKKQFTLDVDLNDEEIQRIMDYRLRAGRAATTPEEFVEILVCDALTCKAVNRVSCTPQMH